MQKAAEKKKNWRRKHEDFINALRSAKEYTEAEATGMLCRVNEICTRDLITFTTFVLLGIGYLFLRVIFVQEVSLHMLSHVCTFPRPYHTK